MDEKEIRYLKAKATQIRINILEMIGKLGVGHIGGSLSIAEVLSVLYFKVMRIDPKNPNWEKRDRFVLSKGHAGPALYSTLLELGYFPREWIDTLNKPNTNLPSHCDRLKTPGVDMTAGSLGQGLSVAVGMAIFAKRNLPEVTIYALIGDGEAQEGQIWEALMYAGNHKLHNLIVFMDYNKMQIDDYVENLNSLEPLTDKFKAFKWNVYSIDGHDVENIYNSIMSAKSQTERPTMIILNTIKGKGADFCEGKLSNHNMPVTEEQWKSAVEKLKKEIDKLTKEVELI